MMGSKVSWKRRVTRAAYILVFNVVLWIAIPSLLGEVLSQTLPSTPLSSASFIYAFGAVITALQTLAALTEGMAVSVPFNSGGYIASAYYIWAATEGGNLSFSTSGLNIALGFAPIVFLLMLPALFGAVRMPILFLLEQSEVARAIPDEI